jgi:hypothetical protein
VRDGCISPGTYKLLRFDFLSYNAGNTDLHVGDPASNPDLFVWSVSHGHYHLRDFNEYRLLNTSDQEVKPGFKQAFCLMDIERTNPNASRSSGLYTYSNQGISAGWSDVDSSTLPCQYVDITGVPDGNYRLAASTNFKQVVHLDNSVLIGLRIRGDTVTVTPLNWGALESLEGETISRDGAGKAERELPQKHSGIRGTRWRGRCLRGPVQWRSLKGRRLDAI